MNKRRKILLVASLIVIFAVAGSGVWFLAVPNVDFWLDPTHHYRRERESWVTVNSAGDALDGTFVPIYCKNSGLFAVTLEVSVTFSGATFSTKTPQPYEQVNANTTKFTFTLGAFETKKTDVYFTIQNGTRFTASLSISSSQLLNVASAQHSIWLPWDVSYRELHYYLSDGTFYPAVIL